MLKIGSVPQNIRRFEFDSDSIRFDSIQTESESNPNLTKFDSNSIRIRSIKFRIESNPNLNRIESESESESNRIESDSVRFDY